MNSKILRLTLNFTGTCSEKCPPVVLSSFQFVISPIYTYLQYLVSGYYGFGTQCICHICVLISSLVDYVTVNVNTSPFLLWRIKRANKDWLLEIRS